MPRHHPAAVGQRRDRWSALVIGRVGIDPELGPGGRPRRVVALGVNAMTPAVLIRLPRHHPAAIGQRCDRGGRLVIVRVGIYPELRPTGRPRSVVTLAVNAVDRPILAVGLPRHHPSAVGQRRDRGGVLVIGRVSIDPELGPGGRARRVVALGVNAKVDPVGHVLEERLPRHHPAAVGQRRDRGRDLEPGRVGIDLELDPAGRARCVVALGVDAVVRSVLALGLPRHHPAAVGQRRDRGRGLVIGRVGVDPELRRPHPPERHLNGRIRKAQGFDALQGVRSFRAGDLRCAGWALRNRVTGIDTGIGGHVQTITSDEPVVAGSSDQGISSGAAIERVGTRAAIQGVVGAVAGQHVVQCVSGAVDGRRPAQRQVFKVGAQRVADAAANLVRAFARQFRHHVACVVH